MGHFFKTSLTHDSLPTSQSSIYESMSSLAEGPRAQLKEMLLRPAHDSLMINGETNLETTTSNPNEGRKLNRVAC